MAYKRIEQPIKSPDGTLRTTMFFPKLRSCCFSARKWKLQSRFRALRVCDRCERLPKKYRRST
jgi:hypothetical protein